MATYSISSNLTLDSENIIADINNIYSIKSNFNYIVGTNYNIITKVYKNILDGVEILLNGSSIKNHLLEYTREQSICSGMQTGTAKISPGLIIDLWDAIEIYENEQKVVTFYVVKITTNVQDGSIDLELHDKSKKLVDYLIDTLYDLNSYKSQKSKWWIEKFLREVGISYTFLVKGEGQVMNPNSTVGRQMAFEQIQSLLQMSGWFMYINPDGVAIIDSLSITTRYKSYKYTLKDKNIFSIKDKLDDSQLRNLAVVWGNSNPEYPLIYVYQKKQTKWMTGSNDWRAVVLSNHSIYSLSDARKLANEILETFSYAIKEKTVEFLFNINISLGTVIKIESDHYSAEGRITTIGSVCNSKDGLKNIITLDQKCPRLFAYLGVPPEPPEYMEVGWTAFDSYVNFPGYRVDDAYQLRSSYITGSVINIALI
jgi:hypothetical protein